MEQLLKEALRNLRAAQEEVEEGDDYTRIGEIMYSIEDLIEK